MMYTDALQAVIMFGCMLFLLFSLYQVLGMGFTEANKELTNIAPLVPEKFKALGHQGWTAMPVTGSPQWYSLVTSLILGVGIGCLAQPQLVVRFMTVESSKQLNRGVFIGCFFLIITVGAIYHAGALSNLFFLKTEGAVATEVIQDIDKIIPYFINKAMPDWFAALFMLCILSASMSTLSSQFHTMGASVGSDIYGTSLFWSAILFAICCHMILSPAELLFSWVSVLLHFFLPTFVHCTGRKRRNRELWQVSG